MRSVKIQSSSSDFDLPNFLNSPRLLVNLWRIIQLACFFFINAHVEEPYMDEIFHVPQAQAYCQNRFLEYDSKLTTPPGLYILSWALHQAGLPCRLTYLRGLNLFIGVFMLPKLCSRLYGEIHKVTDKEEMSWAQSIPMMPVLSFFSLLYYTDIASTYVVLLTYYLTLKGHRTSAIAAGFGSLWFRQTNIVWFGAFIALDIVDELNKQTDTNLSETPLEEVSAVTVYCDLRDLLRASSKHWCLVLGMLIHVSPIILFTGIFLYYNGSIVLGDKDMHQAGFYPIQIMYMMSFVVLMSSVSFLRRQTFSSISWLVYRPLLVTLILCTAFLCASQKSIQHPFLLADNRHYTFYLNKRLIQLAPVGLLATGFCLTSGLFLSGVRRSSFFSVLAFGFASVCTLCPTSLLETRYYIVPFMLWRLHLRHQQNDHKLRWIEGISWMALHLATIYLFLYKYFLWPDTQAVQRFMW